MWFFENFLLEGEPTLYEMYFQTDQVRCAGMKVLGLLPVFGGIILALGVNGCSSREDDTIRCGGSICGEADVGPMDSAVLDSGVLEAVDTGAMDAPMDAGPVDAPVDAPDSGPGETALFVVNKLRTPTAVGGEVIGFNVDGLVSDAADADGCNKMDYTSPAPDSETGVDNQLGPLLTSFETQLGLNAAAATAFENGTLLLLIEVTDIDDYENDAYVGVNVLFGRLPPGIYAPELDSGGFIAGGQTFDIDATSYESDMMTPHVRFMGSIVDGRLHTDTTGFTLALPYNSYVIMLAIKLAELRFNIAPEGLETGIIGGALDVEDLITAVSGVIDSTYISLLRLLLGNAADLKVLSGACDNISVGMTFTATTAVLGDVVR